jgi:putative phosphoserine phosphatase/1-acylglycerol-3-phosphate O-acyltransferase
MLRNQRLTQEVREGPTGSKVGAFFDLDQTILAGFSATSFVRERLLTGRMSPREMAGTFYGALSFGLGRLGFSGLITATTATYRGVSEAILEEVGLEVFEKHLARKIYPESRALVEAHQEAGHTVAIISSATRYQIAPFARDLGIEHVMCTELEVEDGVFTGEIIRPVCYGEGKAIAARGIAQREGLDLEQSYFYTDSDEDLPLLEAVGRPRPLNPNRRLAQIAKERGWPVRRFHSRGRPSMGDIVRTGLSYASAGPALGAGLMAGMVNGSYREALNVSGAVWSDLATSLAGIDLRIEGEEHAWARRPAVFVFNHQSALDPVLMLKIVRRDMTGVGNMEIRNDPLIGPFLAAAGVVFIDRSEAANDREAIQPAVEALRQGRSIAIAPEGARSLTPRLRPFRRTAFQIAMEAGVPIVPVVLSNVLDAFPKDARIVRPATIEATVLPPIETVDWAEDDLDEQVEAVRRLFLEQLHQA